MARQFRIIKQNNGTYKLQGRDGGLFAGLDTWQETDTDHPTLASARAERDSYTNNSYSYEVIE